MAKDFESMEDSNRSTNPTLHAVSDPARRVVLHGGAAAALAALFGPLAGCATAARGGRLGFAGVPVGDT